MAEAVRAIICSKSAISLQRGPVDPKFQVEGVAPTNHSSSQKTGLNDLSYGVNIWTDLSSVLSQSTRLLDGRTDGRTAFSSLDRVCIPCSAVKKLQQARSVGIERGAWGAQSRRRPPPNPPDRGWHGGKRVLSRCKGSPERALLVVKGRIHWRKGKVWLVRAM